MGGGARAREKDVLKGDFSISPPPSLPPSLPPSCATVPQTCATVPQTCATVPQTCATVPQTCATVTRKVRISMGLSVTLIAAPCGGAGTTGRVTDVPSSRS
jgi:hypothetical protein